MSKRRKKSVAAEANAPAADPAPEFKPWDEVDVAFVELSLAARKLYHDPVFLHLERIPKNDTRLLFVGHHSLFAMETPMLLIKIYKKLGIQIRPLGEKFLFTLPGAKEWLGRFGGVEGTRENCSALMRAGHPVLVFPGGTREASHARGMAHKLDWGDRAGFAQMAADHGYTVVPFACVGIDDQWDYIMDGRELAQSALGKAIKARGWLDRDELFPPILKGIGPTLIPKPNRHYYGFADPISSKGINPKSPTDVWVLREDTRVAIEALLAELLAYREQDPRRDFRLRFAEKLLDAVDVVRGTLDAVLSDAERAKRQKTD